MKYLSIVSALALSATLLACDKEEKQVETAPKTAEAEATQVAAATPTNTTNQTGGEEAGYECGAAEGKAPTEHAAKDCMKKTEEMAAKGEEGGCNQWDEAADKIARQEVPADAKWKVLAVSGMTCGGCERRIIANVGKLDGVVAVEADSELGQVRVAIAAGNKDAGDAARSKITELGYKLQ